MAGRKSISYATVLAQDLGPGSGAGQGFGWPAFPFQEPQTWGINWRGPRSARKVLGTEIFSIIILEGNGCSTFLQGQREQPLHPESALHTLEASFHLVLSWMMLMQILKAAALLQSWLRPGCKSGRAGPLGRKKAGRRFRFLARKSP